jgi:hypothetical protein
VDLASENLEQSRPKGKSPQPTGSVARVPKTRRNECARLTCRQKSDSRLLEVQADLEEWLRYYTEERVPQGRWCYGRTPRRTFWDTLPVAEEKFFAA